MSNSTSRHIYNGSELELNENLLKRTTHLYETVGEVNWNYITGYVNHFYATKRKC